MWTIKFSKEAEKQMKALDQNTAKIIQKHLRDKISQNPTKFGKALVANLKGFWRYRIGDYRVICDIKDRELVILVIKIGHRSKIYDE